MTNTNASSLVWANFLDIDNDVKPWLQMVDFQPDPTADIRLQLITDMTCQWVQNKIARPIVPTQFDRRFDGWAGWNGTFIELPYYPILEVISVVEWWGISGPHVLTEQTPTNQVDGYQVDYEKGRLSRVFPGLVQKPWFPGSRNIEIVWESGYNPIPADVKIATLEMIAHWWRNTQQQSGNRPMSASMDYDPDVVASGLWQGVPLRILTLLETYVQVGIG